MKSQIRNTVFVLFLVSWANADSVNLALHKDYTFTPKPNYELTTDSLDYKQLTDGVIDESFWYESHKKKTVGWVFKGFVDITLDLGKSYNIDVVKIYTTGGGRAGVEYPEYIIGMASLDGTSFSPVSIVDSDSWKSGVQGFVEPKVMKLEFGVKCRYVKILVRPNGHLFFSDELEVLASENDCETTNAPFLTNKEAIDYAERLRQIYRNIISLSREYRNSGIEITNFSKKISLYESELDSLKINLSSFDELKTMEGRFNIIRAEFLKSKHKTPWFYTKADAIDILRFADMPPKAETDCELSFCLWQNEYSFEVLNLVNCSEKEMEFSLFVSSLAIGDKYISSVPFISIRRACYVYSKNAGFFADPLVLQGNVPFTVKPGETVQLFIELNSKNLVSGEYNGAIAIRCDGEIENKIKIILLNIEIAAKSFPENIDFMTCNWDYITDRAIFTNNIAKMAVDDLKKHRLNVTVISPYKIFNTNPVVGKKIGKITINPQLKNELELREHAKIRLLFLDLKSKHKYFGEDINSIDWKLRFKDFIRDLVTNLNSLGYSYDDYAIYPYDEDIGEKFIYVARLIRGIDSKIKIYANSVGEGISDVRKAVGLVDIWCPYLNKLLDNKKLLDEIKTNCKEVWCYGTELRQDYILECAKKQNKLYHRTMPIKASGLGITGAGFWTYADWRGGHYNYYDKRIYGAIYDGEYSPKDCVYEPIVPSKRWQMWREGVEDAVALKEHPELLEEFMAKSPNEITSKYLQNLRKRADEGRNNYE